MNAIWKAGVWRPNKSQKQRAKCSLFLVQKMGLEPTPTYRRLEPDGSDTSVNAEKSDFMPFSALLFSG